jgi:hypothetical protein
VEDGCPGAFMTDALVTAKSSSGSLRSVCLGVGTWECRVLVPACRYPWPRGAGDDVVHARGCGPQARKFGPIYSDTAARVQARGVGANLLLVVAARRRLRIETGDLVEGVETDQLKEKKAETRSKVKATEELKAAMLTEATDWWRCFIPLAGLLREETPTVTIADTADLDDLTCPITSELMTDPVVASDGHTYDRSSVTIADTADLDDLNCPITSELMTDPVVASDGHTYDRSSIERAWAAARETAAERMLRAHDDDCGSAHGFVGPLSPLTGEVVTDVLTPNHLIVKMIEARIEAGSISAPDAAEWRERRRTVLAQQRSSAAPQNAGGTPVPPSAAATPPPPAARPARRATQPSANERRLQRQIESLQTEIGELNARARAAGSVKGQVAAVKRLSRKEAELDRMQTELATAQSLRTHQEEAVTPQQPLSARGVSSVLTDAGRRLRRSLSFGGQLERGVAALQQARVERSLQSSARREEAQQRAETTRENERLTAEYLRHTNPFTGERVKDGDLRMCGRCHAGPFTKTGCNDMSTHNSWFMANRCRNCFWFNSTWTNWPVWDGVIGPHRLGRCAE